MPNAFARNRSFWVQLGWGLFAGLLSALGTLLFVVLMNLGISLVWPEEPGPEPFSGSVRILVIMSVYEAINCSNNSEVDAALYAPNGDLNLHNPNSTVYGAVLGQTIAAKNNILVTYDPSLSGSGETPACGCP